MNKLVFKQIHGSKRLLIPRNVLSQSLRPCYTH